MGTGKHQNKKSKGKRGINRAVQLRLQQLGGPCSQRPLSPIDACWMISRKTIQRPTGEALQRSFYEKELERLKSS